MADQDKQQDNPQSDQLAQQAGQQGNIGLYGQGQYTNEGLPDQNTQEGQQLQPDQPGTSKNTAGQPLNQDAYSEQNDMENEILRKQYGDPEEKAYLNNQSQPQKQENA